MLHILLIFCQCNDIFISFNQSIPTSLHGYSIYNEPSGVRLVLGESDPVNEVSAICKTASMWEYIKALYRNA